jgi:glycosyltransferase involved in cell wall biosynthesis
MPKRAAQPKRILFLASQFPHPANSGATIKTSSILDHLRDKHDVHLLCLRAEELDAGQLEWAERFAAFESVEMRRGRNALNLARSYASRVPLSIVRNLSSKMRTLVERVCRETEFDAVLVDGWLMAQYVPEEFAGKRLLHEHNAEYVMWERQAAIVRGPALRRLVRAEARRVRAYEAGLMGQFAVIFAVSEEDRKALIEIGADDKKVKVLPNLPDQALLEAPPLAFEACETLVLYLGTLSWQPNLEGIERFLREVWPLVHRQRPQARLLIAGRGASPRLRRLAGKGKGVELAGDIDDPEPLYKRARVFIEATRSGGGTKVKLLNALARGLPIVASPESIEGLEVSADEHLLVADKPPTMAAGVVQLLSDAPVWRRLSENGRKLIQERYTPSIAYKVLNNALGRARARA